MSNIVLLADDGSEVLLIFVGIIISIFVIYSILFIPSIAKYTKKQNELLERQNELLQKILDDKK